MSTPIVVVAFNRPRSLSRLLESLSNARYLSEDIPLIISIDKGDNMDVLEIAKNFSWTHGEKKVVYREENLKLRRHILTCGDYSQEYGSVIILEDDLYVSKDFYTYTMKALDFTKNDSRIGGISLYNHRYNVNTFEPFEPVSDAYDNWYFQFASSWGEAWTKTQWSNFRSWYEINQSEELAAATIPSTVTNWSPSSWLKYFIKYLIETDTYFLYPRVSLTTNFGDAGTHAFEDSTGFQVPLRDNTSDFHFSTLEDSVAIYDAFFENTKLYSVLNLPREELSIDLYGSKPLCGVRYLLSSKIFNYKIIKKFAQSMRPLDANILYALPGNDLFLYDTFVAEKNPNAYNAVRHTAYNLRPLKWDTYKSVGLLVHKDITAHFEKKIKSKRHQ